LQAILLRYKVKRSSSRRVAATDQARMRRAALLAIRLEHGSRVTQTSSGMMGMMMEGSVR